MVKKYNKKDPNFADEASRYESPVPSRDFIMDYMREEGRPVSLKQAIQAFDLKTDDEKEGLRRRFIAMARDGQTMSTRKGDYELIEEDELIKGRVQGHKDGFGFVVTEASEDDIFLSAREMMTVFPGDEVMVRISGKRGSKQEGIIVKVLEHKTEQLLGRLFRDKETVFVQPDHKQIAQDIIVVDEGGFTIKDGEYVLLNILSQPHKRRHATGEVVEHLGDATAAGMEARLAAYAHGLPFDWPEDVLKESDSISDTVDEADCKNRLDLRALPFVTIDGADSRDFDDAVYVEPQSDGSFQLYVAIADVAHYVGAETVLDDEAYTRGNSVYFPNEVIPMLPESLSNGICSLNPKTDRLVLCAKIAITKAGKLEGCELSNAVMHSHARLTYTEVAEALESKEAHPRQKELDDLHALYSALKKQRQNRGCIEFEVNEPLFLFDDNGKIDKITVRQRNVAHMIIEECMLAANVSVSHYLEAAKLPFLYRIHETPDVERLLQLRDFLSKFSLQLSGKDKPTTKDYSQLMEKVMKRDDAHLIQTVVLRSLKQAVYSPEQLGHFGLAYESYCHFTSPIRRYPDLLVHRAIKHSINGGSKDTFLYKTSELAEYGGHLSTTERRADKASRDAMDRLKCEYMQDKLGQEFSARIIDVMGFGMFVECEDNYIQGLLHVTALGNDYYDYDSVTHCLRGKRGGKIYRLGEKVTVLLAKVDTDERRIDFALAESE